MTQSLTPDEITQLRALLHPPQPAPAPPTYARSRCFRYEVARIANGRCTASFLDRPPGDIINFINEKAAYSELPIEFIGWQIDHRLLEGQDRFLLVEQLHAAGQYDQNERIVRTWPFTGEAPIPNRDFLQEIRHGQS
jgi:hypothetical protein